MNTEWITACNYTSLQIAWSLTPKKSKLAKFEASFSSKFTNFLTSNATAKPLLKLRLPGFASFSSNLKNQKPSIQKTKTFISIKLRYFHYLSHSLQHGAKIVFKILFLIFDDVFGLEFREYLCSVSI